MNDYETIFVQDIKNQVQQAQQAQPKKMKNKKKVIIITSIVLGIVVIMVVFYLRFFLPEELICNSMHGGIKLSYNTQKIIRYETDEMSFDLDAQNKLFKELGSRQYIQKFSDWFKETTGMSCDAQR